MKARLRQIGDGFWNLRGPFKLGGLLDIGTQSSLVRLSNGDFVLLDAYLPPRPVLEEVLALTDGGRAVRAVLNLHPFHTAHVRTVAAQFPKAELFGTRRHVEQAPELSWQALHTDDPALHARYEGDLTFTVPAGVDFIPDNPKLHFASVLAFHPRSRALHVDDTLTWLDMPLVGGLRFHPTLRFVLQKRPGAAAEFRRWAEQLVERCAGVDQLCSAHGPRLPDTETPLADLVRGALSGVERRLRAHEEKHG